MRGCGFSATVEVRRKDRPTEHAKINENAKKIKRGGEKFRHLAKQFSQPREFSSPANQLSMSSNSPINREPNREGDELDCNPPAGRGRSDGAGRNVLNRAARMLKSEISVVPL